MKALTLWQPWASLISWGDKQYETRSWATAYRGPLAIHASKNRDGWEVCALNSFYKDALARASIQHFDNLTLGVVLCIVDLVDVVKTESLKGLISQQEEQFGDHSSGRYAWKLENVRVLETPTPYRGMQQLWDWPADLGSLSYTKVNP